MTYTALKKSLTTAQQRSTRQEIQRYVLNRLRELGLNEIELARSEANFLPTLLHSEEKIGGATAGRSGEGHIMLIATDRRIIVLDCKPFFNNVEDLSYDVIAGVNIGNVGPLYTITLQTKVGDFKITTLYARASQMFKNYIDVRCIEHREREVHYESF